MVSHAGAKQEGSVGDLVDLRKEQHNLRAAWQRMIQAVTKYTVCNREDDTADEGNNK